MGSQNARVQGRRARIASSLHLPLRRLALCLDCEMCFEIGTPACPGCGGETWVLLARFLDQGPLRLMPQFHAFPKSWNESSSSAADADQTAKQLLIVARDRQKLYEYTKRAFAGNPTIEVVLDRRRGERRASGDRTSVPERRRGDRRLALDIDNHLKALGWAVMRLDVFKSRRPSIH